MIMYLIRAALGAALAAGIAVPAASAAPEAGVYALNSNICRKIIDRTEREMRLPGGILQAISLAESGRWDKKSRSRFAWPWTVTAHGKGRFFPSKAAAIAAVRKLKAEGVRNIDVGCLQVNLKYHPDAFETLEDAFDPATNARYAAALFAKLRRANRSITRAVAHYHSTTLYQESGTAVERGTPPVLRRAAPEETRCLAGRKRTAQGGQAGRRLAPAVAPAVALKRRAFRE